jgi:hypothetical protein
LNGARGFGKEKQDNRKPGFAHGDTSSTTKLFLGSHIIRHRATIYRAPAVCETDSFGNAWFISIENAA